MGVGGIEILPRFRADALGPSKPRFRPPEPYLSYDSLFTEPSKSDAINDSCSGPTEKWWWTEGSA